MAQTLESMVDGIKSQVDSGQAADMWSDNLHDFLDHMKMRTVTTLPTAGTSGYEDGEIIRLDGAADGQHPLWVNIGSATSSKFAPVKTPISGYGIPWAITRVDVSGNAASAHAYINAAQNGDLVLAGFETTNDTDTIVKCADVDNGSVTLTASADGAGAHVHNLIGLRSGCVPEFGIVAAGEVACLAADDTTVSRTVTGAAVGDIVLATPNTTDDADQVVAAYISAADTMIIHTAADPGADNVHKWDYVVLRRLGNFQPSHYIAYAGQHTTTGGAAAEEITVTGALATDYGIVGIETSDDTDTINKAVVAADKITVTASADPEVAHKWNYMVVRAY